MDTNQQAGKPVLTWRNFPEFYNHPFIKSIADQELWTISDNNKKPIDMWDLVLNNPDGHRPPTGAKNHTSTYLMTLSDVCRYVENAKNNAYYFDSEKTGHIVLDIEPDCPDELKAAFLNTNYVYGEVSMSGRGFHLIYKTPECLKDYPEAMKKTKMQDSARKFEFLMEHWVTFTRQLIPPAKPDAKPIDEYFEEMCAIQKYTERKYNFDVDAERPENIRNLTTIMFLMRNNLAYKRTVEDFHGDMSRYEFGFAAMLYRRLNRILKQFKNEYTQTEKAWILYDLMVEKLDHRDKHDTLREGKPWLLYLVQEVMAKNTDDENTPTAKSDAPVYPSET